MFFLRKYNTATNIYIPMVKRAVVDFAVGADWTPAAGNVKVSIDGGAAANITTLPVAIAMGNTAYWNFAIAAAELAGKKIVVTVAGSAPKAVEDNMFDIETYGNASAEYQADLSAANLPVDVQKWLSGAIPVVNVTGVPKVDIVDWLGSAPAALTTSGYVQAMLLRWLTDNAAGTPNALTNNRVPVYSNIQKNVAFTAFPVLMVSSADHLTPLTGLTVTCQISKDGGAFAASTNAVAEVANGKYKINLTATELNANVVSLYFTATGADGQFVDIITTP